MTYRPIDHSDAIACVRAMIISLTDLDPEGEWSKHRLVRRYQLNRYSLTRSQFRDLNHYLLGQIEAVHAAKLRKKYYQANLWGEDAQKETR